jgi:Glycosyltransferase family 92
MSIIRLSVVTLLLPHLALLLLVSAINPHRTTTTGSDNQAYFALCAAVKDTPDNIRQWVKYHTALGINKIYLMDTDDPQPHLITSAIADYIASGQVEFYSLPRVTPRTINLLQVKLYDACLQSARGLHKFVGFWDIDEFLIPLDEEIKNKITTGAEGKNENREGISTFLQEFEEYGGLAVGWRVIGPSGHITKPLQGPQNVSESILASYTLCTTWDFIDNEEVKTIANAEYTLHPTSDPHTFVYKDNKYAVDADKNRVEGGRNPIIRKNWREKHRPPKLALYHYVTKSEEEYREKMQRGSAMGNRKDWAYFKRIEEAATEVCLEAKEMCAELWAGKSKY